jgi:hypothetical protein
MLTAFFAYLLIGLALVIILTISELSEFLDNVEPSPMLRAIVFFTYPYAIVLTAIISGWEEAKYMAGLGVRILLFPLLGRTADGSEINDPTDTSV